MKLTKKNADAPQRICITMDKGQIEASLQETAIETLYGESRVWYEQRKAEAKVCEKIKAAAQNIKARIVAKVRALVRYMKFIVHVIFILLMGLRYETDAAILQTMVRSTAILIHSAVFGLDNCCYSIRSRLLLKIRQTAMDSQYDSPTCGRLLMYEKKGTINTPQFDTGNVIVQVLRRTEKKGDTVITKVVLACGNIRFRINDDDKFFVKVDEGTSFIYLVHLRPLRQSFE